MLHNIGTSFIYRNVLADATKTVFGVSSGMDRGAAAVYAIPVCFAANSYLSLYVRLDSKEGDFLLILTGRQLIVVILDNSDLGVPVRDLPSR